MSDGTYVDGTYVGGTYVGGTSVDGTYVVVPGTLLSGASPWTLSTLRTSRSPL
jgi:hypothetical protein